MWHARRQSSTTRCSTLSGRRSTLFGQHPMVKVAIVTSPDNGSPRVLAESLNDFIRQTGHHSDVLYELGAVRRLKSSTEVKPVHGFLPWMLYKALHFLGDFRVFKRLKTFDAIVICECCPAAFLKHSLNIQKLKARVGMRPILYYEVYYLENSPTIVASLREGNHHLTEQFDWHLAVSEVTEIKGKPQKPWSQIGLYLKSSGLGPNVKNGLLAVVDFEREGHEEIRRRQLQILEELKIPCISLEKRHTIREIRAIYQRATFYFIQSREAFGVPIAECLCCGCYVLMPDASWAMSWRLDEDPQVHGPGVLADCFVVYSDVNDLRRRMIYLKESYDLKETPRKIFEVFREYYPTFYDGNLSSLKEVIRKIQDHDI